MSQASRAEAREPGAGASTGVDPRSRRGRPAGRRWLLLAIGAIGSVAAIALAARLLGWGWASPSLERAEDLIASRRYAEAAKVAEGLLRGRPKDPRLLFTLARARTGSGDLRGAVEALRKIPDWSLYKDEARFFEAKALMGLHRGREAERLYRECSESRSPLATNADLELLALYAMEERRDEFERTFWKAFPTLSGPDRLAVLTMRMRVEFEQTKPEVNAEALRAMVEADPGDYHARAGLAASLDRAGDLESARVHYEKALAEAPDALGIRERYLDLLHRLGRTEALRAAIGELPPGAEERPEILKFRAGLDQASGNLADAARLLARARDLAPNVPEYRHRLAQVLNLLGRRQEAAPESAERDRLTSARDRLRKAWNLLADTYENRPDELKASLLVGMARACSGCGMTREAEAWLAEAERLEPGSATGPDASLDPGPPS